MVSTIRSGTTSAADLAQVDNDRFSWLVGSGHVVFCDVFNAYAEQYGIISVLKITCPEDFTPTNGGTYEYYETECTETTEGVSFKLDGESTGNPGSQETDQNGQVTWNEREADTYYITEEPPEERAVAMEPRGGLLLLLRPCRLAGQGMGGVPTRRRRPDHVRPRGGSEHLLRLVQHL